METTKQAQHRLVRTVFLDFHGDTDEDTLKDMEQYHGVKFHPSPDENTWVPQFAVSGREAHVKVWLMDGYGVDVEDYDIEGWYHPETD